MNRTKTIEKTGSTKLEVSPETLPSEKKSELEAESSVGSLGEACIAYTACPELSAERAKLEDRIEAQRRADRLRELEAIRERAKLD